MARISVTIPLLLLAGIPIHAQSVSTLMGARQAGIASTSATLSDAWSLFNNAGGLGGNHSLSASFSSDVRPALQGSNRIAASLVLPLRHGTSGLGLFRFGDELYNEQLLSAGYGNQIGSTSLGLSASWVQYRSEVYGVRHALGISIGGITQLTPKWQIGAYIFNINQPSISRIPNERLPIRLVAGWSWKPSPVIALYGEVEKDIIYRPTLRVGMEYQIKPKFYFRSGFNLHPQSACMGMGWIWKQYRIDYAYQYAAALSGSHMASISYAVAGARRHKKP